MPRITFQTYLHRRAQLATTWRHAAANFSMLSAKEQWDLHDYYRHSEQLTKAQLHQHWRRHNTAASSRPQRAGRAYAAFTPFIVDQPVTPAPITKQQKPKHRRTDDRHHRIRGQVHPAANAAKAARLLLELVRQDRYEREVERVFLTEERREFVALLQRRIERTLSTC